MDKEDEDVIFIDARGYKAKIHPSITSGGGSRESSKDVEIREFLGAYPYDKLDGVKQNAAGANEQSALRTAKGAIEAWINTIDPALKKKDA